MSPRGYHIPRRKLQNDKDDKDKNVDTDSPTVAPIMAATEAPTVAATSSPTLRPTTLAPTPAPTVELTPEPTLQPTVSTPSPTSTPTQVPFPTASPTFDPSSIVETLYLQFSLSAAAASSSSLPQEQQEETLREILNVAMCSTGVQLITRNKTDACPGGIFGQGEGDSTVLWNQPVATVALWESAYWRWNFSYSVLELGDQTQETIQELLDESIASGRMDDALLEQWNTPSRAWVVGTETPFITGVPLDTAETLRWIGVGLGVVTVLVVMILTKLARQHRHRKDSKSIEIVFSSSAETTEEQGLEDMLTQSRQYALHQKTVMPPSLLQQSPSEDDEYNDKDDVILPA